MNYEKNRSFFKAGYLLFSLNILASALNYLCQLIMARVLSIESYGTVNIIFSLMMIIAVPGSTLTMVVAKHYAGNNTCKKKYLITQLKITSMLTICVFVFLVIIKNFLSNILAISGLSVTYLAFLLAATGYYHPLYSGVFSGCKKFFIVGLYSLFIPVYKIVAIIVSYFSSRDDGTRLITVLIIMLIGVVLSACIGHIVAIRILGDDEQNDEDIKVFSIEEFRTLVLNLSLVFYMNIDILVVRYYGNEKESGLYSAVLLLGRVVYYFAVTLGTILLPTVATSEISNRASRRLLDRALGVVFALSMSILIPTIVLKDKIVYLLYGESYSGATIYFIYVSLISLALSLFTVIVNYAVGKNRTADVTKIMVLMDIILICEIIVLEKVSLLLLCIGITGVLGSLITYLLVGVSHEKTK